MRRQQLDRPDIGVVAKQERHPLQLPQDALFGDLWRERRATRVLVVAQRSGLVCVQVAADEAVK